MLYFTSIDAGKTWVGCRAIRLYKVKEFALHQPWVTPDKVVYIGQADRLGVPVQVILAGIMRNRRRTWYPVSQVLPESYTVTPTNKPKVPAAPQSVTPVTK